MINDLIVKEKPAVLYIAIGCALGGYSGDYPPQQYPPFIKEYKSALLILIDPLLESPPRVCNELNISGAAQYVTVVPIREYFDFTNNLAAAWLNELYNICMSTNTKVIVQDYSGRNIRPFYPTNKLLHGSVLFDVTYGDGACFPDLNKVYIEKDANGNFIHPEMLRLSQIYKKVSPHIFEFEFKHRTNILVNYIQRFYRIQLSLEEVRDWCTEEHVRGDVTYFSKIYNLPNSTSPANLRQILIEAAIDMHEMIGAYTTTAEIAEMVDECFNAYSNMIKAIKSMI